MDIRFGQFALTNPDHPPCTMAYYEWGPENAEEIVVCVHGLTRNARDFDYLARYLASGEVGPAARVICPDMPGRGLSEPMPDPALYDYRVYARVMSDLLDHLSVKTCAWVGTSMGGIIGMVLAAFEPNRITRLVLNDIGPFIPATALERLANWVGVQVTFPDRESYELYLTGALKYFSVREPEHMAHMLEHSATRNADGSYTVRYDPRIAHIFRDGEGNPRAIEDANFWPVFQRLKMPTLLLRGGESDLLLAHTAQEMAETHPDLFAVEIPGVGHCPALMIPEEIGLVTRYLAGDSPLAGARRGTLVVL